MRRTLLLGSLLAATACPSGEAETTNPPDADTTLTAAPTSPAIPLDPALRTGTLDNGLTYFIRKHHKPEARAALWLAVDAGSVLEDEDQRGLAHFVEHMAFNGTKRFEKNTLIDFIEKAGMDFGADLNAFTSFDETVYMLTVPTDQKTMTMGFDILEDWSSALTFDPTEVDKERGVVIEEWRLGRGAGQRAFDQQQPIFLAGSKYADRKPIGEKEILESAPVDTLRRYYNDWYRPDNMAVIVIGDVDPDAMEKEIKARFGGLKNPEGAPERINVPVPLTDETRVSIVADDEQSFSSLSLAIKGPLTPLRTEADARAELVEQLFHGMLNDRLGEIARTPESPFMFAFGSTNDMGRAVDVFRLWAGVKPGQVDGVLKALITEIERVRQHGFVETEFERQKVQLLRRGESAVEEEAKSNSRVFAFQTMRHFLGDDALPSRKWMLDFATKTLEGITLEEVNAVATEWTSRKDRVVLASGATRDKMPAEKDLLAVVDSMAELKVDPYIDDVSTEPLMADAPTPGTITDKRTIESIGTHVWTLSNGATVVVKPTDFKNDEIRMSAFSPGGHSLASDADFESARSASSIVARGGLGKHDATQLEKLTSGKLARSNAWIGELEEGLWGSASPKDAETFMQMIHLGFTQPRKDPQAFGAWKESQIAWIKNRDLNPQSVFREEVQRVKTSDHARKRWTTLESLETVDLEKSFAFYQDRFADAGDFTFVFVGNIDLASFEKQVETYLASLPTTGRKEKWKTIKVKRPRGTKNFSVVSGQDPKSSVAVTYHGVDKWSPEAEDDLELLSAVLDIRLREVLREEMSGVYGAYSRGGFERRPTERYEFSIGFGCAPENVDKLMKAVNAEIVRVKKEGADEATLEKVRENRRRGLETDLKENGFWMNELTEHFRYDEDPATLVEDKRKAIERVENTNVKKAAKRFLKTSVVSGVLKPDPKLLEKAAATGEATPKPAPAPNK